MQTPKTLMRQEPKAVFCLLQCICQALREYQIQLQNDSLPQGESLSQSAKVPWRICQSLREYQIQLQTIAFHKAITFARRRSFLWRICQGLWDCSNAVEGESLRQAAKFPWRISQSLREYQIQLQTIAFHKAITFARRRSFLGEFAKVCWIIQMQSKAKAYTSRQRFV